MFSKIAIATVIAPPGNPWRSWNLLIEAQPVHCRFPEMSKTIELTADDGHIMNAYESSGDQLGGAALVVLQEIFGVNHHIRSVADTYAGEGLYTLAPALFDRTQPGAEFDYSPESIQTARTLFSRIEPNAILKDIAATIAHARSRVASGKVGVIGYCLGGRYAWLSATRLNPDAVVGYYGRVLDVVAEEPRCPVMLHFGSQDQHIPVSDVEKIKENRPSLPVFLYDAGHGFNCDERPSYSEAAASLAFTRSLAFLKEHLHA
jgi:carboxymethylenebutenolidase